MKRCSFAVIGGGPAGMEAARALAAFGHTIELFEAEGELGGQFRLARQVPGKEDYGETIRYFTHELARLGVQVHLERTISPNDEDLLRRFDGIVLATGVVPRHVDIPGADLPHVLSYPEAFSDDRVRGERLSIIGGGGIGVDLAHRWSHGHSSLGEQERFLEDYGLAPMAGDAHVVGDKAVTLMRRHGKIGERIGRSTRWTLLQALRRQGVRTYTDVSYDRIAPEGVWIIDAKGHCRLIEADTVIIAAGQERNDALVPLLERLGIPFRIVGGALLATELDAVRAFEEGLRAAGELVQATSG